MEISKKFGYRTYVFYSENDVMLASKIHNEGTLSVDQFEHKLEEANVEFCYELLEEQ